MCTGSRGWRPLDIAYDCHHSFPNGVMRAIAVLIDGKRALIDAFFFIFHTSQ